jgi:hypothetical protein
MGYEVKNLSHEYVAFAVDFLLLMLVVVVIRPIFLLLIYVEFSVRIFFLSIVFVVHMIVSVQANSVREALIPVFMAAWGFRLKRTRVVHFAKVRLTVWQELRGCVTCVLSLSLLTRFFSVSLSPQRMPTHHDFESHSFFYRFCHHML